MRYKVPTFNCEPHMPLHAIFLNKNILEIFLMLLNHEKTLR
jgi:hypothetical protein